MLNSLIELTEQEKQFLRIAVKTRKREIFVQKLKLKNTYEYNLLRKSIQQKLEAINLVNALFIAGKLNLI